MDQNEFRRTFYTFFFCGDPESKETFLYITPISEEECRNELYETFCSHAHAIFVATPEMVEAKLPVGFTNIRDAYSANFKTHEEDAICMKWISSIHTKGLNHGFIEVA